ncbi:MAG: alanine:cation symporter family protein [Kiritimatiellae bacterium]|nr:alanine:cation symporter family protein [Kiritimatiellia bacterium]
MELLYSSLLYLTGWPLAVVLFIGGLYFTIRTGVIQAMLKETVRVTAEKPGAGKISSFSALMVSTASRVGSGNIIGVSVAICSGGPGAVFWMWLTATIGGASAFVESTLAQIFKRKKDDGTSYGGPAYYIESTLKSKTLAIIFTLALIFTYGVGYNMLASYNLQSAFSEFEFYKQTSNIVWYFGAGAALLFFICVCGGCKSIIRVTSVLVPLMGVAYILFALLAVVINAEQIPGMFKTIFQSAFDFKAIFGGFAGSVIMLGMKRGLYSNEAGIGSAPNAAASADVSHPVKQGLVQMLSVFIDTLIICSATAFMCLCTDVDPSAEGISGAPYVQQAVSVTFGVIGPIFIAAAMVLFTFTTLLGNFFYVENCLNYLFGKVPSKAILIVIRFVGAVLIACGAGIKMGLAWDLADIAQCILAFINIPVCMIIGGYAYKALKDYKAQRREGKNPVFKSKNIGIDVPTDFWN